jgi:integrase
LRKQRPCRGPLSNQSIDHVLKELRYLLRLVKRKGYLERVPEIPFLGRHGKRVLKVSLEDFRKMVDELPPRWWPHRALMMMALNTGQRLGDLLAMTWDQVDFERGIVTYRSSKTDVEDIRAPLLSSTIEELEALLHFQSGTREGFIFLNPRTGKPMVCIKRALVNACKRSGVPRFTMHHVRHLATTVLLEATNGDRDLVRRIIGWSSMAMVDRYGHVGNRAFSAFANVERMLKSRFSDGC